MRFDYHHFKSNNIFLSGEEVLYHPFFFFVGHVDILVSVVRFNLGVLAGDGFGMDWSKQ